MDCEKNSERLQHTWRRPLAETLIDLAAAMGFDDEPQGLVRVRSLSLELPIEVRLRRVPGEWQLLADVPLWRWQSGFEEQRGRLRFRINEEPEP